MARASKSVVTAYLFWLFLCGVGGHRMYLHRPLSGLFLALINITGTILLGIGFGQQSPEYLMIGGTILLAVIAWCLLDAFLIPSMVHGINEPETERNYASLAAVNLDPSHPATTVGVVQSASDAPRRSALPDDYQRPWQKEREKPTIVRYRSEE